MQQVTQQWPISSHILQEPAAEFSHSVSEARPQEVSAGCSLHEGGLYLQTQSLWFLASSKPGLHSQATLPRGASLQMWLQP